MALDEGVVSTYTAEADEVVRPGTEDIVVLENGEEEVMFWLRRGELMSALQVQSREWGVPVSRVLTLTVAYGMSMLGYDMNAVLDALPPVG